MLNLFRIGLILISWTTVIFLPKKIFFKYLPVTLFSSIIILIEYLLGGPRNWWKAKGGIKAVANNGLTFTFGPYFVGNLWSLFSFSRNFSNSFSFGCFLFQKVDCYISFLFVAE